MQFFSNSFPGYQVTSITPFAFRLEIPKRGLFSPFWQGERTMSKARQSRVSAIKKFLATRNVVEGCQKVFDAP